MSVCRLTKLQLQWLDSSLSLVDIWLMKLRNPPSSYYITQFCIFTFRTKTLSFIFLIALVCNKINDEIERKTKNHYIKNWVLARLFILLFQDKVWCFLLFLITRQNKNKYVIHFRVRLVREIGQSTMRMILVNTYYIVTPQKRNTQGIFNRPMFVAFYVIV